MLCIFLRTVLLRVTYLSADSITSVLRIFLLTVYLPGDQDLRSHRVALGNQVDPEIVKHTHALVTKVALTRISLYKTLYRYCRKVTIYLDQNLFTLQQLDSH